MAKTTTNTNQVNTTVENTNNVQDNQLDNLSKEELKSNYEGLQNEVNELKAMLAGLLDANKNKVETVTKSEKVTNNYIMGVDPNMPVIVMNGMYGTTGYMSKSGYGRPIIIKGLWNTLPVQASDIIAINSEQREILENGWLIVLNDEVVKALLLDKTYENILNKTQIENLFDMELEKLEQVLTNCPNGMKITIAKYVIEQVKAKNHRFNDLYKLNLCKEKLGITEEMLKS